MKSKFKWLIALAIFIVIIVAVVWNVRFVGETSIGLDKYNLNEKYYLTYNFIGEGIVKPKINDIELLDEDYRHIPEENNYFGYEFFIDEGQKTGVSSGKYIYKSYSKFKGYKVNDKELTVVLGINFRKKIPEGFAPYMKISYKVFGMKRSFIKKLRPFNISQINSK